MDKLFIALIVMFALLISAVGYFLFVVKQDGSQCITSPLEYGLKVYAKNGYDISCTCGVANQNLLPFIIDKNGTRPLRINSDNRNIEMPNFSSIKIFK